MCTLHPQNRDDGKADVLNDIQFWRRLKLSPEQVTKTKSTGHLSSSVGSPFSANTAARLISSSNSYAREYTTVTLRGVSVVGNVVARGSVVFVVASTLMTYQVG